MAGSYNHVVRKGKFITNDAFPQMIENLGDAYEMAEEMFFIIQELSNGNEQKIKDALKKFYKRNG